MIRIRNISRDVLMLVGAPVALAKVIVLDPAPIPGAATRLDAKGQPRPDRSFVDVDDATAELVADEVEKWVKPAKGPARLAIEAAA